MKRKIVLGTAILITIFLVGAGVFRSQEVPEVPEPSVAPVPPTTVFFGEGGARLGVRLQDVSPEKARQLKLPAETGAIVTEVEENSPASKAGLAKNDVVLEFDGERVRSVSQLRRLVRETPVGRTVALKVNRAGETRNLNVKLEAARERFELLAPEARIPHIEIPEFNYRIFARGPSLGVSGEELTFSARRIFRGKAGQRRAGAGSNGWHPRGEGRVKGGGRHYPGGRQIGWHRGRASHRAGGRLR